MFRTEMSSRERMEAVLDHREADHMPFWPKLTPSYRRFQQEKWRSVKMEELHEFIGSDYLSYTGIEFQQSLPRNIHVEAHCSGNEIQTEYAVGAKKLVSRHITTLEAGDSHPVEYPIKKYEDILAMTEYYAAMKYEAPKEALAVHLAEFRGNPDKLYLFSMPPSPLMQLIQYEMGLENFAYMMYDYPDETEDLIAAMHGAYLRLHELACEASPAKYFLSVENTSSTLIGPDLFDRYCKPQLCDYGEVMRKHGQKQILHMCGKLKALLPGIAQIPAVANEAFSSPTTGDTTVKDGFTYMPGRVIIGGSCATTWAKGEASEIAADIIGDIGEAGTTKNLFLSSGGVMPFSATPEMIRAVWDTVKNELYG